MSLLDGNQFQAGAQLLQASLGFSPGTGTTVSGYGETNVSPDYKQSDNAFTGKIVKVTVAQK